MLRVLQKYAEIFLKTGGVCKINDIVVIVPFVSHNSCETVYILI